MTSNNCDLQNSHVPEPYRSILNDWGRHCYSNGWLAAEIKAQEEKRQQAEASYDACETKFLNDSAEAIKALLAENRHLVNEVAQLRTRLKQTEERLSRWEKEEEKASAEDCCDLRDGAGLIQPRL